MKKILILIVLVLTVALTFGQVSSTATASPPTSTLRAEFSTAYEATMPKGKCWASLPSGESKWVSCSPQERAKQKESLLQFLLKSARPATPQAAPQVSPTPIKADNKAKEFKSDLTVEEGALLRPLIDEFNKWTQKLNAAGELLDKSEAAASTEVEALQLQLAAKDIRTARKELQRLRGEFGKWEAEIKKNHDCAECRFDEATGKLVKPSPPAPQK